MDGGLGSCDLKVPAVTAVAHQRFEPVCLKLLFEAGDHRLTGLPGVFGFVRVVADDGRTFLLTIPRSPTKMARRLLNRSLASALGARKMSASAVLGAAR